MPQTIKVTVYKVTELEGKAKQKALNHLEELNSYNDYSYVLDNFNGYDAEKAGVKFTTIYSDNYGNEQGAELEVIDKEKLLKFCGVDLRTKAAKDILDNGISIKHRGLGGGSGTIDVDCGYSNTDVNSEIPFIETRIKQHIEQLCSKYVREFNDAVRYDIEEPQLIEMAEINSFKFFHNGERYRE